VCTITSGRGSCSTSGTSTDSYSCSGISSSYSNRTKFREVEDVEYVEKLDAFDYNTPVCTITRGRGSTSTSTNSCSCCGISSSYSSGTKFREAEKDVEYVEK
jgi:hypothetical protein